MGATIRREQNGIWVVHLSGAVGKDELDAVQSAALKEYSPGEKARVLVMVDDDFRGLTGGVQEWSDVSFIMKYGDKIAKIAIIGNPAWEQDMLMFTGAGVRLAPVRYFNSGQLADAQNWLL
ncbi:MAG: STAS/SEC14 domain-containing protein [Syntrophaceae bacterium]